MKVNRVENKKVFSRRTTQIGSNLRRNDGGETGGANVHEFTFGALSGCLYLKEPKSSILEAEGSS